MVQTGEADWAAGIGLENKASVPKWKISGTTEVYALILDTMWHPELKKKKVRENEEEMKRLQSKRDTIRNKLK